MAEAHTAWQDRAAIKRARNALIPATFLLNPPYIPPHPNDTGKHLRRIPIECGILSGNELEITSLTTVQILLDKVAAGVWTSEAVARAFMKRAAIAQQVVSATSGRRRCSRRETWQAGFCLGSCRHTEAARYS